MRILCFGDSNTYGYDPRSYLGDRYPPESRWPDLLAAETGWQVENAGLNGRTIPRRPGELAAAEALLAAGGPPDVLLVLLGGNDLLLGASPEDAAEWMGAFLRRALDTLPPGRVLLASPPPLAPGTWVADPALPARSAELGRRYRALAETLGVPFVDTAPWQVPLAFDGVHFTEAGHRLFARRMAQALNVLFPED